MPRLHRLRALFSILSPPEQRLLTAAALIHAVERIGIVAVTATTAFEGVRTGALVTAGLAVVFILRAALMSTLRLRCRGRTLEVLVAALLADTSDVANQTSADAEPAMLEGLYATDEILGQSLPQIVGDGLACVVVTALIAYLEPARLVIAGVVAVVAGGIAAVAVRRVAMASAERQWKALLPALENLSTAVQGRVEVVSNGCAPALSEELRATLRGWRTQSTRSGVVAFLAGRAPVVGAAAVVGLFLLVEGGWENLALVHAAVLASVTPAFAGLAKGMLDVSRALVRASALTAALARASSPLADGDKEAHLPAPVVWDAVSFAYASGEAEALHDVSVTWSPGELLGLAGQNGSGKSTFVRLLLGLHRPTKGALRLGDVPLADVERASLRARVAYLAQRPFLPDRMTVARAIQLLAPDVTRGTMESALRRLALWPVLARRNPAAPLEVKLGTLSAGEKQRVAIARALVRQTPMLLLDEPDANLDAEGIALVSSVLREESKARMVLVVAHSRALLDGMDRVVRFDAGGIVG